MRFNACNPCCTNLPAWTVYHSEVDSGMHVIQVAVTLAAYNSTDLDSNGNPGKYKYASYLSYLFFDKKTTDEDGNIIWRFKNCPNVEGGCTAVMNVMMTDKEATGKCAEQVWLKAAHIVDFTYTDSDVIQESGNGYSTFKLKFSEGKWVNTCCHLVDVVNRNYLNLTGNLGLEDDWQVLDYNKNNAKPNPSFWFTTILCPKAGTVNYGLVDCPDQYGNYYKAYQDTPIGDFSIGTASPGNYWMVGTTPPTAPIEGLPDVANYDYAKQDPNGFYFSRWSLNTFGNACGFGGSFTTQTKPCESYTSGSDTSSATMQTNPLYLDSACGFGYYYNGFQYYNYWPWQYFWGSQAIGGLGGGLGGGYPANYWGWGSWNYGWWWQNCELSNPGPYYAWAYGYQWGGPFYGGGLGGAYWGWWGTYPCNTFSASLGQGLCWPWAYNYGGWWGYYGWWWWGGNSSVNWLGDWVNNTNVPGAFDQWYADLAAQGFENGTCAGYSTCDQFYGSNTTPLKCYARGTRPITITMPVTYKGDKGTITMKGDIKLDGWAVNGTVYDYHFGKNMFQDCGIGMRFTGSLKVTGLVEGTCDVTFDYSDGGFLVIFDLAGDGADTITTSFFGSALYTKSDGTKETVLLNGAYSNIHHPNYPYNTYTGSLAAGDGSTIAYSSFGDITDGELKLNVKMDTGKTVNIDSGMDFKDVKNFNFSSTLQGDTYYSQLMWKRQNCNNNIQCVPKHPVMGEVNMQHINIDFFSIYQAEGTPGNPLYSDYRCVLKDIIPTIHTYCFSLSYFDPKTKRHALDELLGDSFVKIKKNPPLDSYTALPWDKEPCGGDVQMVQQATIVSDKCLPMEDDDDEDMSPS